jgi:hypothetical protein
MGFGKYGNFGVTLRFDEEKFMISKKELLESLVGKKCYFETDESGFKIYSKVPLRSYGTVSYYDLIRDIGVDLLVFERIETEAPYSPYSGSEIPPKRTFFVSIDKISLIEVE